MVASAKAFEFVQYTWSPDSRWIAYAKPEEEVLNRIYLYSLDRKSTIEVTDGWYASASPAFSADGKYLFFVSNRDFTPLYSAVEYDYFYQDMSRVYLVTLSAATDSPFKPKSDEVEIKKEAAKTKAKPAAKEAKAAAGIEPHAGGRRGDQGTDRRPADPGRQLPQPGRPGRQRLLHSQRQHRRQAGADAVQPGRAEGNRPRRVRRL